ncbi:unnamed protein product [Pleuronectes platessa]|uniref:Uncharacterized protein n=1 Tax=Pleuronectes platessa TaxID=8262 RepID=A0A9N7V4H1_PLEPL|nr:unnamed protein product [Pleuronectes platessa]
MICVSGALLQLQQLTGDVNMSNYRSCLTVVLKNVTRLLENICSTGTNISQWKHVFIGWKETPPEETRAVTSRPALQTIRCSVLSNHAHVCIHDVEQHTPSLGVTDPGEPWLGPVPTARSSVSARGSFHGRTCSQISSSSVAC